MTAVNKNTLNMTAVKTNFNLKFLKLAFLRAMQTFYPKYSRMFSFHFDT